MLELDGWDGHHRSTFGNMYFIVQDSLANSHYPRPISIQHHQLIIFAITTTTMIISTSSWSYRSPIRHFEVQWRPLLVRHSAPNARGRSKRPYDNDDDCGDDDDNNWALLVTETRLTDSPPQVQDQKLKRLIICWFLVHESLLNSLFYSGGSFLHSAM